MNFQRWFLLLAGFASACSGGAELWTDGGVDASDAKPGKDASESDVTLIDDAGSDTGEVGDAASDAPSPDLVLTASGRRRDGLINASRTPTGRRRSRSCRFPSGRGAGGSIRS